jgi:single stranded DNA-binding protein
MFRVAVSGRKEQEASFFTVVVWRDQAEHAAESLTKGGRVVVVGRLQQRAWTAEDGSAHSTVEMPAEEPGPSLRLATASMTRATRSSPGQEPARPGLRGPDPARETSRASREVRTRVRPAGTARLSGTGSFVARQGKPG